MSTRHAMTTADAAWLGMDRPTNLMIVNSVMWFDEPLGLDQLRAVFLERIVLPFPRFRQRVTGGSPVSRPAWEDDPAFDLSLHVHHLALPHPGDRAVLQEVVGDLITRPLDHARPLWDVYLLEGYGRGCAVLVRMHHCIADGIALARVMLSLTDADDAPTAEPPLVEAHHSRVDALAHLASTVVQEAIAASREPARLDGLARRANQGAATLAKLLLPGRDTSSSLKGEQHIRHLVAWTPPMRLTTVKAHGAALGATVNDILVAAVAGAVGRHLAERGESPDVLHAMVPFNLRPADEPLSPELGNRFGLVILALPVATRGAAQRVREVHENMDAIKHSDEAALSYGILQTIGRTPVAVEELIIDYFSAKATMVMTNVPGPRSPVSFAGTPVRGVLVWAPCSGSVTLSVSVFSYAGKVTVGFLTDAGLIPEPERLVEHFGAELRAIGRAAATARAHASAS